VIYHGQTTRLYILVNEILFKIKILEAFLRSSEHLVAGKEFVQKLYTTRQGEKVVFRLAKKEEAPFILETLKKLLLDPQYDKDLYHIVATRAYAEVLTWIQARYKDKFVIIGVHESELIGIWNARMMKKDVAVSLHSITFKILGRIGTAEHAAKAEYKCSEAGSGRKSLLRLN